MTALRRALRAYVDVVVAGEANDEPLRAELRAIQHRNAKYFNLAVVMLVMLSLGMAAAMTLDAIRRTVPLGAALIASAIGLVRVMLGLWREKVATEMLIALSDLDTTVLKQVVAKLLRQLR